MVGHPPPFRPHASLATHAWCCPQNIRRKEALVGEHQVLTKVEERAAEVTQGWFPCSGNIWGERSLRWWRLRQP